MSTHSLPPVTGPVRVSIKDEDVDDNGAAFGPVCVAELTMPDDGSNPFGPPAHTVHELGWMGYREARAVAAHYGVTLATD